MTRSADQDCHLSMAQTLAFVVCMVLMQIDFVQGQDYKCEVQFDGECISKVSWKIQGKYAEKRRPFTVAYRATEGRSDTAVLLHYVGHYLCDAAGEHTCESNSSISLNRKTTACVTNRTYTIAADGEDEIPCTPAQSQIELSGSNPDKDKNNATDSGKDTFLSNGAVIGISCTVAFAITNVIFVIFRWRRQRKITKNDKVHVSDREGKEEPEKETFPFLADKVV